MRARLVLAAVALLGANAYADPAIWKISNGESTQVWLLGSVHYLREQDYPLPAVIESLYEQADKLVMEIDLDALDPSSVQTRFFQAAMLPPARTLSSVLDPDVYAQTEATADELGLDLAGLEPFEPWLVALTLMDLGMARLGFRPDQGLEQHLLRRASQDGKAVDGLETLADQIGIFDGLPAAEQQALLSQTLDELRAGRSDMDELLSAWRSGSLDALAAKLGESFVDFPRLYESLVVNRNERWIDEIERLAGRPGRTLVIVGALHLVGEHNVVSLLRARGIDVARMTP